MCSWSQYDIRASYCEIYTEKMKDLIANNQPVSSNLTTVSIHAEVEIVPLMTQAKRNRTVAATKANDISSRSHTMVLRLVLLCTNDQTTSSLTTPLVRSVRICIQENKKTRKQAGLDWWKAFMKRHPNLAIRKLEPTAIGKMRAFNRHNMDLFHENLRMVFTRYSFGPNETWNCGKLE